jgi:ribonuclease-3
MASGGPATGKWPDSGRLEERLGHVFGDRQLLERALTHVSANKQGAPRSASYQRLEFLGDRVLGLAIAELLFATFPRAPEGEMSRRLAELVRKETCADVALDWDVGPFLRLGESELLTGGARNTAILGDVCEAIIGAVFLDAGYDAARALVERSWIERLKRPSRPLRDPKTALQEWAQGRGLAAPTYREVRRSGPAHAPVFTIAVQVEGFADENAQGASKRTAEQAAARAFMARQGIGEAAGATVAGDKS